MGELSDSIIAGEVCQYCMFPFEETQGYPATCSECRDPGDPPSPARAGQRPKRNLTEVRAAKPKTNCPTCRKRVNLVGLKDHQRDVHGVVT